jgi:hypothetical protein
MEKDPPKSGEPHWRNPKWQYIPSSQHTDAREFRKRMEMRRKEIQTTPRKLNEPTKETDE